MTAVTFFPIKRLIRRIKSIREENRQGATARCRAVATDFLHPTSSQRRRRRLQNEARGEAKWQRGKERRERKRRWGNASCRRRCIIVARVNESPLRAYFLFDRQQLAESRSYEVYDRSSVRRDVGRRRGVLNNSIISRVIVARLRDTRLSKNSA